VEPGLFLGVVREQEDRVGERQRRRLVAGEQEGEQVVADLGFRESLRLRVGVV